MRSCHSALQIRGQVPRKQGLKPFYMVHGFGCNRIIRGQVPRKQGLKQDIHEIMPFSAPNPRASSKKTRIETSDRRSHDVEDRGIRGQVPRKQGLKHGAFSRNRLSAGNPRASSKKTRIETRRFSFFYPLLIDPRASSKKTRIETKDSSLKSQDTATSEGKFQENKD